LCVWQDLDDPAGRPERIAKQIMVEYGEHVKKKQVKQPKKPKKNAELLELKVRLRCQDSDVRLANPGQESFESHPPRFHQKTLIA
jgi:hypothetical protein